MLAAENWCVKVQDKVYGPYTTQQMRKFAHEGRLAGWSLVAPAGGRAWREARREIVFANFFGKATPEPKQPASRSPHKTFGKRSDCEHVVNEDKSVSGATAASKTAASKSKPEPGGESETVDANFVVIFDVVSAAASRVEAAMLSLGPAFRIADNVWHVTCELTAVGVRNAIAPYLRGSESIFVVDATRGRSAWSNYAPEANAKITAAHSRAL